MLNKPPVNCWAWPAVSQASLLSIIGADGRRLFVNTRFAQILGYDRAEDILGRSAWDHVAPQARDTLRHGTRPIRWGEATHTCLEYQAVRQDGQPIWLEVMISIVQWNGTRAYLSTLVDIDERKRAEEALRSLHRELEQRIAERTSALQVANQQLAQEIVERERVAADLVLARDAAEQASQAKSAFLTVMSHELRTPTRYHSRPRVGGPRRPLSPQPVQRHGTWWRLWRTHPARGAPSRPARRPAKTWPHRCGGCWWRMISSTR